MRKEEEQPTLPCMGSIPKPPVLAARTPLNVTRCLGQVPRSEGHLAAFPPFHFPVHLRMGRNRGFPLRYFLSMKYREVGSVDGGTMLSDLMLHFTVLDFLELIYNLLTALGGKVVAGHHLMPKLPRCLPLHVHEIPVQASHPDRHGASLSAGRRASTQLGHPTWRSPALSALWPSKAPPKSMPSPELADAGWKWGFQNTDPA